jgi:hydroxyethylthiazole kinase-like uncharacterized protein yjeF
MQKQLPTTLYTASQVKEFDRITIEERGLPGLTLMRRAATACVKALTDRWPDAKNISIYCGSGNNAGDGYIVAGMLAEKGFDVSVVVVGSRVKLSIDAKKAWEYCLATNSAIFDFDPDSALKSDVIVDALLGIGATRDVKSNYALAIEKINTDTAGVLSIDVPSGLDADTGLVLGFAVKADITVSFIGLKRGLLTADGAEFSGEIIFDNLGADTSLERGIECLRYSELITQLPKRPRQSHKNNFGHVLVIGGDSGMGGAVAMAAEASLRSGAGLVSVFTHADHASAILARCPELMVRGNNDLSIVDSILEPMLKRAKVIVLGPGLGQSDWSEKVFQLTLAHILVSEKYAVIDADALTKLADHKVKNEHWVLTPHPGEAARLLGTKVVDRFAAVSEIQARYGGIALLKGSGTLIRGESETSLCPYGNPGMSTAGMGDILCGVIAALIAQSCSPYFATQLAVAVHSVAADESAKENGERGLLATDLMQKIRRLLNGY